MFNVNNHNGVSLIYFFLPLGPTSLHFQKPDKGVQVLCCTEQ